MKITDKNAVKELSRARSSELWMSIENYPEDERDGRSDLQMVADECSYILSCFDEDGHTLCEELQDAKGIIRETKNGKTIPLWQNTLQPKYRQSQIQIARDTINEYKRLKSLMTRLEKQGFYGKW